MKTPVVNGRPYYRFTGTRSTSLMHVLQNFSFFLIKKILPSKLFCFIQSNLFSECTSSYDENIKDIEHTKPHEKLHLYDLGSNYNIASHVVLNVVSLIVLSLLLVEK